MIRVVVRRSELRAAGAGLVKELEADLANVHELLEAAELYPLAEWTNAIAQPRRDDPYFRSDAEWKDELDDWKAELPERIKQLRDVVAKRAKGEWGGGT